MSVKKTRKILVCLVIQKKVVVTLGVMRPFSVLPGAQRACGDFGDPTAVSRFNHRVNALGGMLGP